MLFSEIWIPVLICMPSGSSRVMQNMKQGVGNEVHLLYAAPSVVTMR